MHGVASKDKRRRERFMDYAKCLILSHHSIQMPIITSAILRSEGKKLNIDFIFAEMGMRCINSYGKGMKSMFSLAEPSLFACAAGIAC